MAARLRILLAVDGSQNSQRLARRVGEMAAGGTGAEVTILRVVRPMGGGSVSAFSESMEGPVYAMPAKGDAETVRAAEERA